MIENKKYCIVKDCVRSNEKKMKLHLLFHFNQLTFICDFNVCREFDVYRFRTKHLKRKNGLALFLITGKTAVRNYNTDTKKRKNVFLKADVALKEI